MTYELRHGVEKQTFETGAQRDTAAGKPRLDLLSPIFLYRMGDVARTGGEHYGDRNWEKGMPLSRILASAFRHLVQTMDGQEDEDHAIQCAFNLMMYVHTLHKIQTGSLPMKLDDVCREQNLLKKNLKSGLTPAKKPGTMVGTANGLRLSCCRCRFKFEVVFYQKLPRTFFCPRCGERDSYGN